MTAKQFRQARVRLGYTQARLAEVLQLSRMTISRYEAGTWEIPLSVEMALDQLGSTQIPMLGMVAAGTPIEPISQAELVAVLPPLLRGGETFALRVKGESMKDDGILPGDCEERTDGGGAGQQRSDDQEVLPQGRPDRTASGECRNEADRRVVTG
jgi:repressor LexA